MSVSCYFGATEHGKSWHVAHNVIPTWKKVIIFDPTPNDPGKQNFPGDEYYAPNEAMFLQIFRKYISKDSYSIIIKTSDSSNDQVLCDRAIHLALILGKSMGTKVTPEKRIQMIIDEAGSVCSAHYQSPFLKRLVTKGRHSNVDSHFIVQNPMAIHNQIRSQATNICSFFVGNASTVPAFVERFSREICQTINTLPIYYRFEWKSNEEMMIFDQNNKIVKKFDKKTPDFLSKKGKS